MPIIYSKFFSLLKAKEKTMYDLRKDKVVGVATIEKMRKSEGHIDTRSIEKLCEYLDCQPGDIMEYVPDRKDEVATEKIMTAIEKLLANQNLDL